MGARGLAETRAISAASEESRVPCTAEVKPCSFPLCLAHIQERQNSGDGCTTEWGHCPAGSKAGEGLCWRNSVQKHQCVLGRRRCMQLQRHPGDRHILELLSWLVHFFSCNLISSFVTGSITSSSASSDVPAAKLNRADRSGLCCSSGARAAQRRCGGMLWGC